MYAASVELAISSESIWTANLDLRLNCSSRLCRSGRKKQNIRCVRFDVDGESRALLVAIREIAKGERLYYDYNAYQQEYPTQHFV